MFGGGGGGFDPRKMQQMMQQFGIDLTEIDAEEIVIRTPDEDLVFEDAEVQRMDAQGQKTFQVIGEPDHRPRGDAGAVTDAESSADSASDDAGGDGGIPDADVEIVAGRAEVTEDAAREALEAADGDLAAAIERLE